MTENGWIGNMQDYFRYDLYNSITDLEISSWQEFRDRI